MKIDFVRLLTFALKEVECMKENEEILDYDFTVDSRTGQIDMFIKPTCSMLSSITLNLKDFE